jgi:hypothetical protein
MSECLTTNQPCITATGATPKQLVNGTKPNLLKWKMPQPLTAGSYRFSRRANCSQPFRGLITVNEVVIEGLFDHD